MFGQKDNNGNGHKQVNIKMSSFRLNFDNYISMYDGSEGSLLLISKYLYTSYFLISLRFISLPVIFFSKISNFFTYILVNPDNPWKVPEVIDSMCASFRPL